MVKVLPESSGNLLALKAEGKLTDRDYKEILIPRLEAIIHEQGKARFLLDMSDQYQGWEAAALWDDARFGLTHRKDFEKMAVVGGPRWIDWLLNAFDRQRRDQDLLAVRAGTGVELDHGINSNRHMTRADRKKASLESLAESPEFPVEVLHPGGLKITAELAALCGIGKESLVLDVASGTGEGACHLRESLGCRVVGIDASAQMIERARKKARERRLTMKLKLPAASCRESRFSRCNSNRIRSLTK